jgi:hypothetical protein
MCSRVSACLAKCCAQCFVDSACHANLQLHGSDVVAYGLQVTRELSKGVQAFTKKHRTALSIINTSNLAMIVWQNLSGAQHVLIKQAFVSIVYVILLAIGQHLLYLAFNYVIIW